MAHYRAMQEQRGPQAAPFDDVATGESGGHAASDAGKSVAADPTGARRGAA